MKIGSMLLASVILGTAAFALGATGKVDVGATAPSFDTRDSNGKSVRLEDYRGKYVVLEWSNFGCPYVQAHYNSGHMQALQKKYTEKGVVWLTIFSSAEGQQGYYQPAELTKLGAEKKMSSKLIPDADGTLGQLYGAKNTPTMFVINPSGHIIYMGGIDNHPTTDAGEVAGSTNYVATALDEALAGKSVTTPKARPYGCGIHYKN